MELTRTIYPVGFGAFCSEVFEDYNTSTIFNVVYDCGSKHKAQKESINRYIKEDYLFDNRKMDVLFVSHFHDDHINCIKQLPLRKDTLIVLPYIYAEYQLLFEFIYGMGYTELILWLQKNGYDNVVLVDPYDSNVHNVNKRERYVDGEHPIFDDSIYQNRVDSRYPHMKPFDFFLYRSIDWVYTPFHLQDKSLYQDFIMSALANGITTDDLRCFDGKDRNITKRIKDLYQSYCDKDKAAKKSLNASSMLLVSRPYDIDQWSTETIEYRLYNRTIVPPQYHWIRNIHVSCLYTGDTPLSTTKYETEFLRVKDDVMPEGAGLVQLPHHGSVEGYNHILYEIPNCSAVFVNCYEVAQSHKGEPVLYTKAIMDAARSRTAFFAVSEDEKSRFVLYATKVGKRP